MQNAIVAKTITNTMRFSFLALFIAVFLSLSFLKYSAMIQLL